MAARGCGVSEEWGGEITRARKDGSGVLVFIAAVVLVLLIFRWLLRAADSD